MTALSPGTGEGVPCLGRAPDSPSRARLLREASTTFLCGGSLIQLTATGHSMRPTIRDGDLLLVRPVRFPEFRRGDILLCRTKAGLVAHRLAWVGHNGGRGVLTLRGDALGSADTPIAPGDVIGHVAALKRDARIVHLTGRWTVRWQSMRAAGFRFARRVREMAEKIGRA